LLIPHTVRVKFRRLLEPAARVFIAARISPSTLTLIGLVPAIAAAYAFGKGSVRWGAVLTGVSGLFDLADGLVARIGKKETRFGALLDSSIDRYSEIAIFIGLAVFYRSGPGLVAVLLALAGSMMVSYTKARAEGLGAECSSGMLQRPERMVLVVAGGLVGPTALLWILWILAALSNVTAVERLLRVRATLRSPDNEQTHGEVEG
jgi:CDP-diacylglycerol--glycerol-3-phosphate 3-phosphatidyltransferase